MTQAQKMVSKGEIEGVVRQIVEGFGPEKIILFGSYAYGEVEEGSDVDLLVVMETGEKTIRVAAAVRERVEHRFSMDIIVRTPEQIREGLRWRDSFLTEVLTRGVVLYEADHVGVG